MREEEEYWQAKKALDKAKALYEKKVRAKAKVFETWLNNIQDASILECSLVSSDREQLPPQDIKDIATVLASHIIKLPNDEVFRAFVKAESNRKEG